MKKLLATLVMWGPKGLLLASFLDGAGLTLPGGVDALIIYLASQRPEHPITLAMVAVLGSTVGNFLLFWLARRGGRTFLEKRSTSRLGKRWRARFQQYGLTTVFIAALVPLPIMPLKIFVLCAGALGSKPVGFLVTFLAGRIPRYIGLAVLGKSMGTDALTYLTTHVWQLALISLALFIFSIGLLKAVDYRKSRNEKPA